MLETNILGYDSELLQRQNGVWTAREIAQQPRTIMETHEILHSQQNDIEGFLSNLLADNDVKVIFTGAGTSSFIGDSLAAYFGAHLKNSVVSIATTDIVSAPNLFLHSDTKTLLVSFGRSGNSPESIRAIELANQMVGDVHHLIITCNENGALAKLSGVNYLKVILPPETHDQSFAMTSSYSAMLFAAFACFSGIENSKSAAAAICNAMWQVIDKFSAKIRALFTSDIERVIYLGSGLLLGMAHEASLKLLELTNGKIATMYDTPLGFRHGPKTFLNEKTLVFVFASNDKYTRSYDLDLANEILSDSISDKITIVSASHEAAIPDKNSLIIEGLNKCQDIICLFPMIAIAQIFALEASIKCGITPDNPNPSGVVNRVVQGVIIHEYCDA